MAVSPYRPLTLLSRWTWLLVRLSGFLPPIDLALRLLLSLSSPLDRELAGRRRYYYGLQRLLGRSLLQSQTAVGAALALAVLCRFGRAGWCGVP